MHELESSHRFNDKMTAVIIKKVNTHEWVIKFVEPINIADSQNAAQIGRNMYG